MRRSPATTLVRLQQQRRREEEGEVQSLAEEDDTFEHSAFPQQVSSHRLFRFLLITLDALKPSQLITLVEHSPTSRVELSPTVPSSPAPTSLLLELLGVPSLQHSSKSPRSTTRQAAQFPTVHEEQDPQ